MVARAGVEQAAPVSLADIVVESTCRLCRICYDRDRRRSIFLSEWTARKLA